MFMLENIEIMPYIEEILTATKAPRMFGNHRVSDDNADLIFVNFDAGVAVRKLRCHGVAIGFKLYFRELIEINGLDDLHTRKWRRQRI